MAFQITDDTLDYMACEEDFANPSGDLERRKMTLPLICHAVPPPAGLAQKIKSAIEKRLLPKPSGIFLWRIRRHSTVIHYLKARGYHHAGGETRVFFHNPKKAPDGRGEPASRREKPDAHADSAGGKDDHSKALFDVTQTRCTCLISVGPGNETLSVPW